MSTTEDGAPAVASDDPANLTGPGVTQQPPNAAEVFDLAAITQQNAELRAQLIQQNEDLKAALADARAAGLQAEGLSDDDVRMIEHPEEYDEAFATVGQHSILTDRLAALETQLQTVRANAAAQRSPDVAPQAVPQPDAAAVTTDPLVPQTSPQTPAGSPVEATAPVGDDFSGAADVAAEGAFANFTDAQLADELARREAGEQ